MSKSATNIALIITVTIALTTALGAPKLLAQSTDSDPQATESTSSEQTKSKKSDAAPKNQTKADSKDKKTTQDNDKSFIPSEEISEDFAVSFPVDI